MTVPPIAQRTLPSRFGPIEVATTGRGVVALALQTTPEAVAAEVHRRLAAEAGTGISGITGIGGQAAWAAAADRMVEATSRWLALYLDGAPAACDLALDLAGLSAWDRRVLGGVRAIPYGRTFGYGELARSVGVPGAARAAGGSVSRNPVALVIPCHRVIAGDGSLGGYGGAWPADRDALLDLKSALLALEGVHVRRRGRVP